MTSARTVAKTFIMINGPLSEFKFISGIIIIRIFKIVHNLPCRIGKIYSLKPIGMDPLSSFNLDVLAHSR